MHTINNERIGKERYCGVKLDMHKEYDHAKWVFLECMMVRLGFHCNVVDIPIWLMKRRFMALKVFGCV
jgi:hypothetical protein